MEENENSLFKDEPVAVIDTNSKFNEDPSQYLKDKLFDAVFRKVWSTVVAKNLQTLVDAAWANEQQGTHIETYKSSILKSNFFHI